MNHSIRSSSIGSGRKRTVNKGRIHWCSYWGTWSRILRHLGRDQSCVEINLSPVNHHDDENWRKVGMVWIRDHGTTPGKNDTIEHRLPKEWFDLLGEKVGLNTRHFLMTADIMSMIDFDKHRSVWNGGAPLSKCLKDGVELPDFITRAE